MLYVDVAVRLRGETVATGRVSARDAFSLGYMYARYEDRQRRCYGEGARVTRGDVGQADPGAPSDGRPLTLGAHAHCVDPRDPGRGGRP